MGKIGIVTDSSGDLPLSYYKDKDHVIMVPLKVRLGIEAFDDWYDISPELPKERIRFTPNQFYQEMEKKENVPYTIPVSVNQLVTAYEELEKECDTIISVHFSHCLGYTVKAAEIAAKKIKKAKVIVIDTLQISNGYGAIIKELIERRDKGMDVDGLVKFVKNMIADMNGKLIMTNKESVYLYRCKRMNLFKYVFACILKLKNFTIIDGMITLIPKCKGQDGLESKLNEAIMAVKDATKANKKAYMIVSHANNDKAADEFIKRLEKEKIPYEKRYLGPITGVYGGPGTWAVLPVIMNE